MGTIDKHIAWLDFADDSMLDAVHAADTQETLDELGLGRIRDFFANYFFPGMTTVMTSARYFLFIPAMYESTMAQN